MARSLSSQFTLRARSTVPGLAELELDLIVLCELGAARRPNSCAWPAAACCKSQFDVRTPESGHVRCTSSRLLWANSGHRCSFDHLVRTCL